MGDRAKTRQIVGVCVCARVCERSGNDAIVSTPDQGQDKAQDKAQRRNPGKARDFNLVGPTVSQGMAPAKLPCNGGIPPLPIEA